MAFEFPTALPEGIFRFESGRIGIDETNRTLKPSELPFVFRVPEQLSDEDGEIGSVNSILESIASLDASNEWKEKAGENFLWILQTSTFQSLGGKKQLGLITTPEDVFTAELASYINLEADKMGVEGPVKYTGNRPEYIGGTRRQHALTSAEFGARAGKEMGLPHELWFATVVAFLLHDSRQSALSHVGEQTLEIALKMPQIQDRLQANKIGNISPDHEERGAQFVESPEIARCLLDLGIDPELPSSIIRNEDYGLGIFDPLAYLYRDHQNISKEVDGLEPFPEELIENIMNSIEGFNPGTKQVQFSREGIGALQQLLEIRLETYRKVYTNPETLKIESMIVDVLTRMLVDGVINVQDFIVNGTDDSIRVNARAVAERNERYRHLIDALDGKTLSNTRVVNPGLMDSEMRGLNLYELKQEIIRRVHSKTRRVLSPDSFYVVPPFDPTRKRFVVEVDGEEVIIATDRSKDPKVHAHQDQLIVISDDSLSEGAKEEIEEVLTGKPGSDESLYRYAITKPFLVPSLENLDRPLNGQYVTEKEGVTSETKVIWEEGSFSRVHVVKKVSPGKEDEYLVEARFIRSKNDGGNRVDTDAVQKVISIDEYDKLVQNNGDAIELLLADGNLSTIAREGLEGAMRKMKNGGFESRIEKAEEIIIKLKKHDRGDVGKIIVRTADEAVLRNGRALQLPQSLPSTLTLIVGKHASPQDIGSLIKVFGTTEGMIPITE